MRDAALLHRAAQLREVGDVAAHAVERRELVRRRAAAAAGDRCRRGHTSSRRSPRPAAGAPPRSQCTRTRRSPGIVVQRSRHASRDGLGTRAERSRGQVAVRHGAGFDPDDHRFHRIAPHLRPRCGGEPGDVRREHGVGRLQDAGVGGQRLVREDVERGAADLPLPRARRRARPRRSARRARRSRAAPRGACCANCAGAEQPLGLGQQRQVQRDEVARRRAALEAGAARSRRRAAAARRGRRPGSRRPAAACAPPRPGRCGRARRGRA